MMKSGFQNQLCVGLRPDSDNIWVLTEPLVYWSERVGRIEVPNEFQTDFSSVPRVPIAYQAWGDRCHREAVLHDYLFRKDSKPNLPFMECNHIFLEAMGSRGVAFWVRYPMYAGVVTAGGLFYHKRNVGDHL
jgi:hypothetical protein